MTSTNIKGTFPIIPNDFHQQRPGNHGNDKQRVPRELVAVSLPSHGIVVAKV